VNRRPRPLGLLPAALVAVALACAAHAAPPTVVGWSSARWASTAGGDGALRAVIVVDRAWSADEASALATELGAMLAAARVPAELAFLESLCGAPDAPAAVFDCAGPWIGGTRAASAGTPAPPWRWSDGTDVAGFGWARGRPAQTELLPAALLLDGVDGPNGRWIDALPEPDAGVSTRSAIVTFTTFTDCDGDDRPDLLEIAANPALDADADGILDACGKRDPADLNGDGRVDATDLSLVLNAWGTDDPAADADQSGRVDAADLAMVLSAWSPNT
jgi:hypothetical protein